MNAVSSFRPFPENAEYAANQERAYRSWVPLFQTIHYLNLPEPALNHSASTFFVGNNERPTIKALVGLCARQRGWSAIINSDIVLHPRFSKLEGELEKRSALCAVSRRFTMFGSDPEKAFANPVLEPHDLGLDIFIAKQSVWAHVLTLIPEQFKIGMIVWDQWVNNCFCKDFRAYCYDFTPSRLVFHPQHGGRPCIEFQPPQSAYLKFSTWPRQRIII